MNWTLSFKTMPDETILEDSTKADPSVLGPTYTVFLTTKRVLFRFNAVGSTMTQSFAYQEIEGAQAVTRLLIPYLCVRTKEKEFFIHTPNPGHWSARILDIKKSLPEAPPSAAAQSTRADRQRELNEMLITLQRYNLLTAAEVAHKMKLIEKLQMKLPGGQGSISDGKSYSSDSQRNA